MPFCLYSYMSESSSVCHLSACLCLKFSERVCLSSWIYSAFSLFCATSFSHNLFLFFSFPHFLTITLLMIFVVCWIEMQRPGNLSPLSSPSRKQRGNEFNGNEVSILIGCNGMIGAHVKSIRHLPIE